MSIRLNRWMFSVTVVVTVGDLKGLLPDRNFCCFDFLVSAAKEASRANAFVLGPLNGHE
jgi:hypothetical protein